MFNNDQPRSAKGPLVINGKFSKDKFVKSKPNCKLNENTMASNYKSKIQNFQKIGTISQIFPIFHQRSSKFTNFHQK